MRLARHASPASHSRTVRCVCGYVCGWVQDLYVKLLSETSVVIPTLARASKELASKELDGLISKDVSQMHVPASVLPALSSMPGVLAQRNWA